MNVFLHILSRPELLYVTVLAKTHLIYIKTEFNFIAAVYRHTQKLSIPSVSSVKYNLVCFSQDHFADSPELPLEQWDPWRVPIGQWGPVFAPTGCVAQWCVIGHCVGIMAAHGVSLRVVFATSLPTHTSSSHPTPPCLALPPIPPTPSIINTDDRKRWQKNLEIQPSETEKVSYKRNQLITKYFAAQHVSTIQG